MEFIFQNVPHTGPGARGTSGQSAWTQVRTPTAKLSQATIPRQQCKVAAKDSWSDGGVSQRSRSQQWTAEGVPKTVLVRQRAACLQCAGQGPGRHWSCARVHQVTITTDIQNGQ